MTAFNIDILQEKVSDFCWRHIRWMALFRLALRENSSLSIDVGVLADFCPGDVQGLAFFTMQRDLSGAIGRGVDPNTANDLSAFLPSDVLEEV